MDAITKLVNKSLALLLLWIIGSAVVIGFYPLTCFIFAPLVFMFYFFVFFQFSKLLVAALKEAMMWDPRGKHLSTFSAGWQMLWYTGPTKSMKKKIWLMHFLPIIAFFALIAEGLSIYFIFY